ncbi:MAG: Spy/CpxP family protein refolding chaperone [Bacillota bacterium]
MKKVVTLMLVVSLVVGGSALVLAYGSSGQRQGRYQQQRNSERQRGNKRNWQEKLNLSEQQSEKIEELRANYFAKRDEMRDELVDKRAELREMYFNSEVSKEELTTFNTEINELRIQLNDVRAEHRLSVRNTLDQEQLEECGEYFAEAQNYRGRGRRMNRGSRGRRADSRVNTRRRMR